MKLTIATKGIVLVAVPLIFELIFVGVLISTLKQSEGEIARELKYQSIIQNLSMVSRGMVAASSNMGNSDSSESEERFEIEQKRTYASIKKLNRMIASEPVLLANWDVFNKSVKIVFENMHEYSKLSFDQLVQRLTDDPEEIRHLQADIDLLSTRAGNLVLQTKSMEQSLPNNDQQLATLNKNLFFSLLANVAITVILAVAFGFDIARRLKKLAENTSRVSRNLAPLPSLGGNDEISQLDMIIHKMADDLHEADTQRKKLLSIVRLRLQNPLIVARESLSALTVEDKEVTDLARKWMGKAISQLGRLESLLNDLTNLDSQIESSQIELKLAEMSTEKVVASSIDAVQSLANKKEVKISASGPELLCQADGERITQVVINFLSNALKFSPAGATVQVIVLDKDSELEIAVKDEGPGVPAEMQSKIFERYEQSSREDATAKGGAGLGLNICKLIVQAHNGEIGVTSESGKGSSFYLRLPKKGPLASKATNISSLSRSVAAQSVSHSVAKNKKDSFFKTRIWHKGLIVVSVPLIFQLAFVFQLTNLLSQARKEISVQRNAMKVTIMVNEFLQDVIAMSNQGCGMRVYGEGVKNDLFVRYSANIRAALHDWLEIVEFERANPERVQEMCGALHKLERIMIRIGKSVIDRPEQEDLSSLLRMKVRFKVVQHDVQSLGIYLDKFLEEERVNEKQSPEQLAKTRGNIEILTLTAVLASVLLSLAMGAVFSNGVSKRISLMTDNTIKFTSGQELNPPLTGSDELAEFDADFRTMVNKIKESLDFKQHLIAVVSHELRTPLTSIIGSLTLALNGVYGKLPAWGHEKVQLAHSNIAQVMRLVNDLLDIERLEAGKFPIEEKLIDLHECLRDAIGLSREIVPQIKVELLPENFSGQLKADPDLLAKALSKLIVYCAESQNESSEVKVEFFNLNESYYLLKFPFVADPNKNAIVFDKVKMLESGGEEEKGDELALAIAKTIFDMVGGKISVLKDESLGNSAFVLELPRSSASV